MKKPRIKKRGGRWLVYREKKKAFQCFDEATALLCYNVLLLEIKKKVERI